MVEFIRVEIYDISKQNLLKMRTIFERNMIEEMGRIINRRNAKKLILI